MGLSRNIELFVTFLNEILFQKDGEDSVEKHSIDIVRTSKDAKKWSL